MNAFCIRLLALSTALTCVGACYVETEPAAPMAPVAQGEVVVADPPPPPPPVAEAPPAPPPEPGMVYVNGYHRWDGRGYVWERGHYERPPRPESRYVPGHWEGRERGKVWVDGHFS